MTHCCEAMQLALCSKNIPIKYSPHLREYSIVLMDYFDSFEEFVKGNKVLQNLDFCPFCGIKLPDSLRDTWFDSLLALGFEPHRENDKIPREYTTEDWWKYRGL